MLSQSNERQRHTRHRTKKLFFCCCCCLRSVPLRIKYNFSICSALSIEQKGSHWCSYERASACMECEVDNVSLCKLKTEPNEGSRRKYRTHRRTRIFLSWTFFLENREQWKCDCKVSCTSERDISSSCVRVMRTFECSVLMRNGKKCFNLIHHAHQTILHCCTRPIVKTSAMIILLYRTI